MTTEMFVVLRKIQRTAEGNEVRQRRSRLLFWLEHTASFLIRVHHAAEEQDRAGVAFVNQEQERLQNLKQQEYLFAYSSGQIP